MYARNVEAKKVHAETENNNLYSSYEVRVGSDRPRLYAIIIGKYLYKI